MTNFEEVFEDIKRSVREHEIKSSNLLTIEDADEFIEIMNRVSFIFFDEFMDSSNKVLMQKIKDIVAPWVDVYENVYFNGLQMTLIPYPDKQAKIKIILL